MIKQHCIGSDRDCDRSTIQKLDGGWNAVFKGSLGFYCWHLVAICSVLNLQVQLLQTGIGCTASSDLTSNGVYSVNFFSVFGREISPPANKTECHNTFINES